MSLIWINESFPFGDKVETVFKIEMHFEENKFKNLFVVHFLGLSKSYCSIPSIGILWDFYFLLFLRRSSGAKIQKIPSGVPVYVFSMNKTSDL